MVGLGLVRVRVATESSDPIKSELKAREFYPWGGVGWAGVGWGEVG